MGGLVIPFDLLSEFSTKKSRGETGIYIEFFWTLGTIFVALIAWASLEKIGWQFVTVMCALPVTVSALMVKYVASCPPTPP